jgi:hypothetical protein
MNPIAVGVIVLTCVFGGALIGMALRRILPEHHLNADSKDVIKMGTGLTATMAALVLALLIASAKSSYDAQKNEVTHLSANIILLDRMLSKYGPETGAARDLLRLSVVRMIDQIWATNGETAAELNPTATRADILYDKLTELSPRNDGQRSLQAQAQKLSIDLAQTRWLLFEQGGSSIPVPFLILLIFWVTIIFLSFGLFAPSNATVIVTLFLCALSVSGAIFLIMELDRPFSGVLRISETPLRNAVTQLGQ